MLKKQREEDNPILAVCRMKYVHLYFNIIKDIGYDHFFIYYWSATKMNVYRKYAKQNKMLAICIGAIDSLVKKNILISNIKTKTYYCMIK